MTDRHRLTELAQQLRVDAVRAADAAGSGHPTSSMSAADLIAVLAADHLRYDFDAPDHSGNDHLIFSKGHASPLLYALYKACGAISDDELLRYRKLGSPLEGHPTPRLPWVDVATGSLGQGLPIGAGIALAGARFDRLPYRVWVLCGDSELAEGSVWEALEYAGQERLANLTAILDINRLGQRGPTRHGWDLDAYRRRVAAFGWHTIEVDGHDPEAIDAAYREARETTDRPTAVIARTVKGQGVSGVADKEGAHGKPVPDAEEAIAELGGRRDLRIEVARPTSGGVSQRPGGTQVELPVYQPGEEVATRDAFGKAVAALGDGRPDVVVLDGEVADSTRAKAFAEAHPDRFVELYIAEQQLVATAVGLQVRGYTPYAATFAAFFSRAYDFVRMAAVSGADINLVGSHAGVSIGEDGPSQMGLEDIASLRAVHNSVVLHPCDANSTARLTAGMAEHRGVSYLRTLRGETPVLYGPDEGFYIGGSKVLRSSAQDRATVVAAGATVHEALRAADALAADGIAVRVIDAYSIKPVDAATLRAAARETGRVVTVEDHWPEGGLGDAVLDVFADTRTMPRTMKLAVSGMPASATPEEQRREAGIDAGAIEAAVRGILRQEESAAVAAGG
ncbi:transketolase [Streptomonospora nanhaiensis]|uniref:transketolase n=1 Tax=Streptomonospora nanhaiensis TaxID=1323731 RepID=UPI001C3921B2|nr:transketolase [Streptomonospora nanhaiensis]MBV2366619.1 transketolase [Streptomonospora nanhaiensis]